MCVACTAPFWLAPARSAQKELAFQQARLAGAARECPRCTELGAEIEALEEELRAAREWYDSDFDPDIGREL